VHHADPRLGPVFLSKVDTTDGFYRIWENTNNVPKLGGFVPTDPDQKQVIGFTLVLPIGCMQSPPLFTTVTETIANLINQKASASEPSGPHHLDIMSESLGAMPEFAPRLLPDPPHLVLVHQSRTVRTPPTAGLR
jgi:hypothetical protein